MAKKNKKKASKSKSDGVIVKTSMLETLLKRVFLGGVLEGCVIQIDKDGRGYVQAVDITNSLFLSLDVDVADSVPKNMTLGLGDLDLILKFVSSTSEEDLSLKLSDNRMIIKRKGHGQLDYLLTEDDLIPTKQDYEEELVENLLAQCALQVELSKSDVSDFLSLMGMIKAKEAHLVFKKGKVKLRGGAETDHQFTVDIGKAKVIDDEIEFDDSFEIPVIGEHLQKVLSVLEFDDDGKPCLLFSEDSPIIAKQNDSNIWALVPIKDEE